MNSSRVKLSEVVAWERNVTWIELPVPETAAGELPVAWRDALTGDKSPRARIAELWAPLAEALPEATAAYACAVDVALLRTEERGLSLLYFFGSGEDETWRRAFPPAALPAIAQQLPSFVKALYARHDGLVHPASHDGGPLPSREWSELAEDDAAPMLVIARDGSSAFGFDLAAAGTAYSMDGEVEPIDDPRAYVDEMVASYLATL